MNIIKNILFDFDGVILDSMNVRDIGFKEIFKQYPKEKIDKLIKFHRTNGGLSRFVKIKYFYENILKKDITKEKINELANEFSKIMRLELIKQKYLIKETINFIKNNHKKYNLHIVSGSEHNELNYLCENLNISKYFLSINGSPTSKDILIKNIIINKNYKKNETILIGDSINDYNAAKENNINFYGFNNENLKKLSKKYINFT
ncbi:MAG: HAD family hydrolase, partial [Nanobdellota archaeon]